MRMSKGRSGGVAMKRGIKIRCIVCDQIKSPHGRSAPPQIPLCRSGECIGYDADPLPGCLWPGETAEQFGYPCCGNATEEVSE